MRASRAVALSVLIGGSTFAGSIPFIAVVAHKRDQKQPPTFAAAYPTTKALYLYNRDGYRVAFCNEIDETTKRMSGCKTVDGYDFDDVMNAWMRAYQDR